MNIPKLADLAQDGAEIPLLQVADDGTIEHHTEEADPLPIAVRRNIAPRKDPYERKVLPGMGVDFDNISDFSCSKKSKESGSLRSAAELEDVDKMYAYIMDYLTLLPIQIYMRVRGTRRDRSQPKDIIVDFDFCVPLSGLDGTHCGSASDTLDTFHTLLRTEQAPPAHLRKLCEFYCAHKSIRKCFQVTRELSDPDFDTIRTGVTALLRPQYLGKVEIGFTKVDKYIYICPPNAVAQIEADLNRKDFIINTFLVPIYIIGVLWGSLLLGMASLLVLMFSMQDEFEHPDVATWWFRSLCYYAATASIALVLKWCLKTIFAKTCRVTRWNNYTIFHIARKSDMESAEKRPALKETQWVRAYAGLLRRLTDGNFEGDATSFVDVATSR